MYRPEVVGRSGDEHIITIEGITFRQAEKELLDQLGILDVRRFDGETTNGRQREPAGDRRRGDGEIQLPFQCQCCQPGEFVA